MPKTIFKPNREIAPAQLVDALTAVMQRSLPLDFQHTRITPEEAWQILAYASVNRQTLDGACAALPEAPSGNRLREVLLPALPSLPKLQGQLNRILREQLHPSLFKKRRPFQIALDLTLIPYHGQPEASADEVMRGEAKSGTTHFHGYATVAIVHDKRRYTLALLFVRLGQTMVEVVRQLLDRVKRLEIAVRRVYLDAGFCHVPVLKTLRRRQLPYLMPIPARGKSGGVRKLFTRRKSYVTYYTLHSPAYGEWTVKAVTVRRYHKGRYGKHGIQWFAYAIAGLPRGTAPAQVFEWYRRRFGIETGYRQMNQLRARTTSRSPVFRLLLVGLAFILVNLYLALRRALVVGSAPPADPATGLPLSLDRMAAAFRQAIEALLGAHRSLLCRRPVAVS
jgi:putative transposase